MSAEEEITEDEPKVEDEMIEDDEGGCFCFNCSTALYVKNCYPRRIKIQKNEKQKNMIFVFTNKLGCF